MVLKFIFGEKKDVLLFSGGRTGFTAFSWSRDDSSPMKFFLSLWQLIAVSLLYPTQDETDLAPDQKRTKDHDFESVGFWHIKALENTTNM